MAGKRRQLGHVTEDMKHQIEIAIHTQAGKVAAARGRGKKIEAAKGQQKLEGMKLLAREMGVKCVTTRMEPGGQEWCFCADSFREAGAKAREQRRRIKEY